MCARLKVGCPRRAPSTNLKRQGFAENQTRASWVFFNNLQAFRSCLEQSLLEMGLASQTHAVSFMACFVPRISIWFSFLFLPFVSQRKKGQVPSLENCLVTGE